MFAEYRVRRVVPGLQLIFRGVLSGDETSLLLFILSITDFSITVFYKCSIFDQ